MKSLYMTANGKVMPFRADIEKADTHFALHELQKHKIPYNKLIRTNFHNCLLVWVHYGKA